MDETELTDALQLAREADPAGLTPLRERTILRNLPHFVALAEAGNFYRAAQRLGLSQSALTRRIQTLEAELDILLFTRTHRLAKLTAAGQALFEDSGHMLQNLNGAIRRAQLVERGEAGHIRLAVNDHALRSPVVIATLRNFMAHFPEVRMHLHAMPSEAQMIALRRKDVDIGFLFDVAIDKASQRIMGHRSIGVHMPLLAVHASHPLASKRAIYLADLEHERLTWPSRRAGRSASESMIAAFRAAGLSPHILLEVMTEETTLNLAAANLGQGFVLEPSFAPPNVVLRRIEDYREGLDLHAVWLKEQPNPATLKIIEELEQQMVQHAKLPRAAADRDPAQMKRPLP